ncbi:MAG: anaerobic ribonucleoside-triphosphate reductase [Candidatus Nealsonbacteria bacterium]
MKNKITKVYPPKFSERKLKRVKKRDGEIVEFDQARIEEAIFKALTSSGQGDGKRAKKVSKRVVQILNRRFKKTEIPQVEQIQDIVEEVLILEGLVEAAKAYILYREQRRRIREATMVAEEAVDRIDQYLEKLDWEVQENANMAFSLQGLNHYGVSYIVKKYWLNKIYPKEIREANEGGDLHIHNLDTLGPYCVGWDLYDLLLKGFGGVSGKIESKPAKHFQAALGQVVNFMYTLQGEAAGAIAFSNFDTLLAPFIKYDNLSYPQVKQALQEFMFNMAIPTRVGFQCVSEDTEILTPEGWKGYDDVERGDIIKTFNLKTREIEDKKVDFIFKRRYQGIMYRLRNRIQDQLISPHHRVLRRKFNTPNYTLQPIEEVLKLKSPIVVPIAGKNSDPEAKISDEQIKLMAWIISEGTVERPGKYRCCHRVSIYQSKIKNRKNYDEIINLLKQFKLNYANHPATSLGEEVQQIRLNAESSREIHQWFRTRENIHFIPDYLLNLSERQSRLFLETYLKGDGTKEWKIAASDLDLLSDLQTIIVNSGYGFTVLKRKPTDIGKKNIYILRIIRHPETYITKIKKVNYEGIIWCPHTENGTIIARRKGKVFITGNCPFTNITIDLKPSPAFAKQPVIIGGKPQKETYGEFEEEMKMFNKALYETMLEGDKSGRPFSFPIPTINITKDFPWDEPAFDGIFEASAKYGTNYFANYINSEMDPSDVRSMCFPATTKIIYKEGKHSRYQRTTIRNLVNNWNPQKEFSLLINGKWVKITDAFKLKNSSGKIVKVTLKNGEVVKMTLDHPAMIIEGGKLKQVSAKNLKKGNIIPIAKQGYEGKLGDFELGRFLGLYISEGGVTKENTVYFSFNEKEKEFQKFVKEIAERRFAFPVHITKDPRWKTIQVWVKSRAAVEWVKKFCSGQTAPEKRLLSSLYGMSRDFRLGALIGIYQGDGYERDVEFHTTNKKLRNDTADLARSVGINYTKRINPNNRKGEIQFTSYVLRLCRDSLKELIPHFENIRTSASSIFKDFGEFYGIKIKSVKVQNYRAPVYDFEVDSKEHLFQLANGVITHNCCRLRLNLKDLYNRGGGGLFGSGSLTGSIGVVTINLPRIGYLSKTKKDFFERLEKMMDIAKDSLEIKRKTVENFIEKGLYPYSKFYLSGIKKMRDNYWGNHFSTIGLVGMNEALLNFIGENTGSKRGRKFALEVLDFMRKKLVKYQKATENIYNLEQTPAESTAYRLALKDKEKYPEIITAGTKKVPYYTNSTQLPVNYTDDIFEALKLQDEIQCKYTGGSVLHLFLGERISDIQTVKNLIKKVFENFRLPYITLTPTFSICPVHGYLSGEHFYCPKCTIKQLCEVYTRIVGYLRPLSQFNTGKQQEFKERKEFEIPKVAVLK